MKPLVEHEAARPKPQIARGVVRKNGLTVDGEAHAVVDTGVQIHDRVLGEMPQAAPSNAEVASWGVGVLLEEVEIDGACAP